MAENVEVPEQIHRPPKPGLVPGPWIVVPFGGLVVSGLVYGVRVATDGLIELVFPDPNFQPITARFCTYYTLAKPLGRGKQARIKIEGNEEAAANYGAVEIFVTKNGKPLPPRGNAVPRTTFGGDGETTVNGPGIVTIHLKTNTPPPKIRVWIQDVP